MDDLNDYAVYSKNEPSLFIWLPLAKLRQDYVCVLVRNFPVEGQARYAFWVAGDGHKTMLYFTNGLAEIVNNSNFVFEGVHGAQSFKIVEGRIQYMMDEGSEWKDLGPITPMGKRDSDTRVEDMRRVHLKNKELVLDAEEDKQLKKALKHDFWSKGGKL